MPNNSFRTCNICDGYEDGCTCAEMEEILRTPLRIRIPTASRAILEEIRTRGEATTRRGQADREYIPQDTCADCERSECTCLPEIPIITGATTEMFRIPNMASEGRSINPIHERTLYLHCDNSCGVIMCAVCMANLDYYLDF